jgi:site-specific DNA-cytosine methylase
MSLEVTGKPLSDTTKYRMIGNSVAVPCVQWIATRLVAVDKRQAESREVEGQNSLVV